MTARGPAGSSPPGRIRYPCSPPQIEGLDGDRDAEVAERLLVTLELTPAGRLVGRVGRFEALGELVEGQGLPRGEQRRGQVDESLEPVGHGAAPPGARRVPRSTARTPAAAAAWKSTGSAAAGRPIETTSRSWRANRDSTSGAGTSTRCGAGRCRLRRGRRAAAPPPGRRRTGRGRARVHGTRAAAQ